MKGSGAQTIGKPSPLKTQLLCSDFQVCVYTLTFHSLRFSLHTFSCRQNLSKQTSCQNPHQREEWMKMLKLSFGFKQEEETAGAW